MESMKNLMNYKMNMLKKQNRERDKMFDENIETDFRNSNLNNYW